MQVQMTTQLRPKTKTDSPTLTERGQIEDKHSLKKMKHTSRIYTRDFDWLATPNKQWGLTISRDVRVALDTEVTRIVKI